MKAQVGLLVLLFPALLFAAPDLGIQLYPAASVDPGSPAFISGRVANLGDAQALDVTLDFYFSPAFAFEKVIDFYGWACTGQAGTIRCRSIAMEPGDSYFTLQISTPPARSLAPSIVVGAFVKSATPDADPSNNSATYEIPLTRFITVDSAADSGPGTLRAAIAEANEAGESRTSKIEILIPSAGVPRIELLSPLPPITVTNIIVGSNGTWGRFPIEPLVELSGARLTRGDGLVLRSSKGSVNGIEVRGFVINGFPGNGILIDGGPANTPGFEFHYTLLGNAIGTDSTGTRAIPNGLRGVAINAPRSANLLRANLISGNDRSGVAIYAANQSQLMENRIGTKAAVDEPLPNGASGVHIGNEAHETSITGGTIAFHRDFGVAIEAGARGVSMFGTKIVQNMSLDIDWGLDGPSLNDDRILQPPVVTGAHYDAARDVSIITGQMPGDTSYGPYMVALVAVADSTNRFGITPYDLIAGGAQSLAGAEFLVEVRGDLRGKYVSAQTVTYLWPDTLPYASSELGLAVQVQ